jgi:hypothetical protein
VTDGDRQLSATHRADGTRKVASEPTSIRNAKRPG